MDSTTLHAPPDQCAEKAGRLGAPAIRSAAFQPAIDAPEMAALRSETPTVRRCAPQNQENLSGTTTMSEGFR
jgi:hypothetical protein